MQGGGRTWLLVGGVVALVVALGSVGWLGLQRSAGVPAVSSGPLAVVLLPRADGTRLAVVDLTTSRVVRRVELRSLATDIAVDASSGLVVCAQAGGLGPAVDRAASLTDVRTGTVRYVALPAVDPGDVACVDGRAYLLHSTVDASGTVFSVVDVASARVTGSGHVAGPPGLWASAAGAVWTTGDGAGGRSTLRRIDPASLSVSTFGLGALAPTGLVEEGGHPLVLGTDDAGGRPGRAAVVAIDPARGTAVAMGTVAGLARSPQRAVRVGARLVVGDWNGDDPETRALRRLDGSTLRDLGPVPIDGVPCALAAWGDRLLVVDREGGRLLVVDPATGRTASAIDLGEKDLVFSDVVVVDEPR
jgi:hypothetical protein